VSAGCLAGQADHIKGTLREGEQVRQPTRTPVLPAEANLVPPPARHSPQILWLQGCVAMKSPSSKHTPHICSYSSGSPIEDASVDMAELGGEMPANSIRGAPPPPLLRGWNSEDRSLLPCCCCWSALGDGSTI
jgi:hypothetical protein